MCFTLGEQEIHTSISRSGSFGVRVIGYKDEVKQNPQISGTLR